MTAAKAYVFGLALLLAVVAGTAPSLANWAKGALILLAVVATILAGQHH